MAPRTMAPKNRVVFDRLKIHVLTGIFGLFVISFGRFVISYQLSMPFSMPPMKSRDPPTVSSRNSSSWGGVQAGESVAKLPSTVGIKIHGGTLSSVSFYSSSPSSSSSSSPSSSSTVPEAASSTGVINDMGCDFGEGVMSLEEILRELPSFVKVQEALPWKKEVNAEDCSKI